MLLPELFPVMIKRPCMIKSQSTVTEIMSGRLGTNSKILEANDGSVWFGNNGGLYRYDGKTITDFKSKEGNN
jgi:ligand-binding sensor domain-containing protein